METRRSFLKKTAMLSGTAGMQFLHPSILQALAIDPVPGSTFMDAEHIVLLMQENRSFDHAFGTLRGVRGFNDPRAIMLPDQNKVWLQTNHAGDTYSPFRLDIRDTKITWMGSLPHGRESQMLARNEGRHDNWIDAKKSGDSDEYSRMPLTMGYYTRDDIPFYYALADAFTVCDQNFCASLTATDPNRLYFWSGTVRKELDEHARAFVDNGIIEAGVEWETFPERLEKNGISWKVYQNEIAADGGFSEEEDVWLGNFGDNVLEYFKQYNVKLSKRYIDYLPKKIARLTSDINTLQSQANQEMNKKKHDEIIQKIGYLENDLRVAREDHQSCTAARYANLTPHLKNIHQKAFATNSKDPLQHQLTPLNYTDDNISREINIPRGDILHQFRADVQSGQLPTVSWLVAPEYFSDHPSAPWFGSWYLSEVMDILTQNPDVWKKTIFILAYDENDGYFDHIPPFVAPDPHNPSTGKVSKGIDTSVDQVRLQTDVPGPIGLGFRVPLVIASPWSRGGWVNSQVYDHTSTLQFLEQFLNKKFERHIQETNITKWRRTVCGDLTSVFRADKGEKISALPFLDKDAFFESIHKAKFKNIPSNFKKLSKEEINQINHDASSSPYMPKQEKGTRPSCALPYELYAEGNLSADKKNFVIRMEAGNTVFKNRSAGSPFNIFTERRFSSYAVAPGDSVDDAWVLSDFEDGIYHIRLYDPNGFYREFRGDVNQPAFHVRCLYHRSAAGGAKPTGNIEFEIKNNDSFKNLTLNIKDNAYKTDRLTKTIAASQQLKILVDLEKSFGWYDFSIQLEGDPHFTSRYAGHVESGDASTSDPLMGAML